MKKLNALLAALCACLVLAGCAPLLEREYSTAEPHSSKFWESEAADTLRAENYQDIVNDLLLVIGRHAETATLRLYNYADDLTVADDLERAAAEIQMETPMGAYAVEYITSTSQSQRGYYEVSVQIGYRRTAEQIQAVVNATSAEALPSLLTLALDSGKTELAVRVSYWDGPEHLDAVIAQVREDRGLTETPAWQVHTYPQGGPVGLIEFLLDAPEEEEVSPSDAPTEREAPGPAAEEAGKAAEN